MALSQKVYDKLTDDNDGRLCDDISERACQETPRSFALLLLSYIFTKLGDAVASPKTTLAWVTTAVGAPAYVLGFLVPLRESGSMLPQLFIGSKIRELAIRKWVWVLGSIGQGLCIAGIGLTAMYLEGHRAGVAILVLIALFSLARSLSSVAAKDVLGKTIAKPKRGQLTGWSASIAGLISVGVGITLMLPVASQLGQVQLGLLLVAAGALWFIAAVIYAQLRELPGETGGGRNALASIKRLRILVSDRAFGRFVATRALLMCSALSAPFYVALAVEAYGSQGYLLGAFLAAAGLASLVSAPVWGRFADSSSKNVMVAAAVVTSATGLVTAALYWWLPALVSTVWFVPVAYFVLSVAHSGVRVGRKTYVVNLASGNQRTDYVAISNTVIGVLLLLVGSIGALAPLITNAGVIAVLSLMGLGGALLGRTLQDVENQDGVS